MDAVELPYPVDVAVPSKLLRSEGFGGTRVAVKEVDQDCERSRISVFMNSSVERCSTLIKRKDATGSVNSSELASWHKIPEAELRRLPNQNTVFNNEYLSGKLDSRVTNFVLNRRSESVQVQQKAGNVSGNSSGPSKRPRVGHVEDTSPAGVDNTNYLSDKQPSHPAKYSCPDKAQLVKQKTNFSVKRGDKRSCKAPVKAMAGFSSASGGNNFLGMYGLKTDVNDITKLVDEMSLSELLAGTSKCPVLVKEKGKKADNVNENFLNSVRKAFSVLPLSGPATVQNFPEIDGCSNKKFSPCSLSSVSMSTGGVMSTGGDNIDKGESCATDLSSHSKDCCNKSEAPANLVDFLEWLPKDVMEQLALPPSKDLESLLQDAAKPSQYSRSASEQRTGKQITRGVRLPPFPWSHTFSGHCKTSSDSAKLLSNRTTCQGRWVIIRNVASSLGAPTDCFTDLESLTYDRNLVPPSGSKLGTSETKVLQTMSGSFSCCDLGSSSVATSIDASHISLYSQAELKDQVNALRWPHPQVFAAAQILYSMATQPLTQSPDGIVRWPKKLSQKSMKARKLKSIEKPEELYAPSLVSGCDNHVQRCADQILPSKRLKLSKADNKRDLIYSDPVRKGSMTCCSPRSGRSSSSILVKDSGGTEGRHSSSNTIKQPCMMPPPCKGFKQGLRESTEGTEADAHGVGKGKL